ncbi:ABC transporter permease [uncultured Aureimonas sp.]|uniref:ABC transporter permease n=1 Tax=uncultured Aureimonas sp. TaxID=1604662 RepID=UPI0025DE4C67|nr:ABC transporter permease [uncultured Aureimonas sp.]
MRRPPFSAVLGLALVALFLMLAAFAPVLAPHSPVQPVGGVWDPASPEAWLGTDNLGRDLLSRLIWGARLTFLVAAAATLLAFALGASLGFLAAVAGGRVDQVLSRGNDVVMSVPTLIFALVVLSILPKSLPVLILVMAVLDSTRVFRVSRAIAGDLAVMDFVEVARLRGEGWLWIIRREILPNAWSPLLAEFGLRFAFAVIFLSTLSFLGLGIQPPEADWGGLVLENKDGLLFGVTAALVPGLAIAVLAVGVNLVVDWLINRAADPAKRGGTR